MNSEYGRIRRSAYNRLDRALNLIAAETIARPSRKYLFMKAMQSVRVGTLVVISPGSRIINSTVGSHVGLGINAVVEDSYLSDGVYVTANALVKNSRIGEGAVVGANAIVEDMEVPPGMVVVGRGKIIGSVDEFKNKRSNRNVNVLKFKRNPMWYWWEVSKIENPIRMPLCVPGHAVLNFFPNFFDSRKLKSAFIEKFTMSERSIDIHPSVVIDPIFPELVSIKEGVSIDRDSVVLTHSFAGYRDHRLEYGPAVIGEGTKVGKHCVVVPGVEVPPDQDIPDHSVTTSSGYYIVPEDTHVKYEKD